MGILYVARNLLNRKEWNQINVNEAAHPIKEVLSPWIPIKGNSVQSNRIDPIIGRPMQLWISISDPTTFAFAVFLCRWQTLNQHIE